MSQKHNTQATHFSQKGKRAHHFLNLSTKLGGKKYSEYHRSKIISLLQIEIDFFFLQKLDTETKSDTRSVTEGQRSNENGEKQTSKQDGGILNSEKPSCGNTCGNNTYLIWPVCLWRKLLTADEAQQTLWQLFVQTLWFLKLGDVSCSNERIFLL